MPRPYKILSDFDGVWTDQGLEAEENVRRVGEELATVLGWTAAAASSAVERVRARVQASPSQWGWAPDGDRISAYVDEDPLCLSSAVCQYIDRSDDPEIAEARTAILGAFGSLAAFSEHCFIEAMKSYRDRHPPCIVPDARAQLDAVLARGVEIVVVSNSSADKIGPWFQAAGIDAGVGPEHQVRLRGSAGKQTLGDTDAKIVVSGRDVRVDRPRYRAAIEEERPDLIIGDVFSLDLALPHVMRTERNPAAPATLAIRRHAHTPAWVLDDRAGGAIDHVVARFADLVELIPG
jgi:hypothetical protein